MHLTSEKNRNKIGARSLILCVWIQFNLNTIYKIIKIWGTAGLSALRGNCLASLCQEQPAHKIPLNFKKLTLLRYAPQRASL